MTDFFFQYMHLILIKDMFACIPFYVQPLIVNEELPKMYSFSTLKDYYQLVLSTTDIHISTIMCGVG